MERVGTYTDRPNQYVKLTTKRGAAPFRQLLWRCYILCNGSNALCALYAVSDRAEHTERGT